MASGLPAAHEAGVVHRDLKPANIMIDGEDNALIMDFGIALSSATTGEKPAGAPAAAAPASDADASATMMAAPAAAGDDGADDDPGNHDRPSPTSAASSRVRSGTVMSNEIGAIVGTIEYMAPEQARGEAVDQRADIYAFGLILSDLLTGLAEAPPGTTPWKALTERTSSTPVPLRAREPDLPEAIDAIVTRCVQLDPADRYQTTAELVAALDRLDDDGNLIPEPKHRRFTPRSPRRR